ncbi:hypothetical protein TW81_09740 [Vibrio galatheae]|uniref:Tail protein n=1 Tax=Vibrio galatheae TaxID=579748 RepID=A0A0F4NMF8_9VIBR|nr:hypothetical protein [Vibrio galatheae]KJY83276.1 hypothetical protein TW81_09740 [Vibrio galatheae]
MESVVIEVDLLRLDQLVNDYYGSLAMFDDVLTANQHLESTTLSVGDEVFLPVQTVAKAEEKLW